MLDGTRDAAGDGQLRRHGLADLERVRIPSGDDWIRLILAQPLRAEPGLRFAYSNAGAHLLSAILTDTTGEAMLTFARHRLFEPLGIHTNDAEEPTLSDHVDPAVIEAYDRARVAWPIDPQGYQWGASLLRLPALDQAEIGDLYLYLYLYGGPWKGPN